MLDREHILDRVERTERDRQAYIARALRWQQMYELDPDFPVELEQAVEMRKEQVITPLPVNTVLLAQRLLSDKPKIDMVPTMEEKAKDKEDLEDVEKFLQAMWERSNWLQHRDVLAELKGQSFVRGRHAVEVKWIEDRTVALNQRSNFPILIRPLDPMNVGYHMGPYYMEFVYHTYEWTVLDLLQVYPDAINNARSTSKIRQKLQALGNNPQQSQVETMKVKMIDFWYVNPGDGAIHNAVLCEDEFVVEPFDTGYPEIPIIVGMGDRTLDLGDEYDGMSILHGIDGLWQFQCRMYSLLATGLLWYFWPGILVTNEAGLQPEDLDIGPGIIETAPAGTNVQLVQIDPNVPLAQNMQQAVEMMAQQSTFPEVLFGKSPGEVQAGYAVSMLGDAARGRVANFAIGLEATMEAVNRLVLAFIEKYAPDQGISIMHYDKADKEKKTITVKRDMIHGNYQNKVSLKLVVPQDEQAQAAQGMRLAESNAISFETMRDVFIGLETPSKEEERIFAEEVRMSDEYRPIRMREQLLRMFPKEKAMAIAAEMNILPPPPEGYYWLPNGKLAMQPSTPPTPPTGAPVPSLAGAPGGGGEPPMEPGLAGAAMMTGPMGGGVPPDMQGQMMPNDLGLPQQGAAELFQEMAGQNPLAPEEELNQMEQGVTGR